MEQQSTILAHILSNKSMFLGFIHDKVLVFQERKLCCNLGPPGLFCHLYNRVLVCIFPQFYVSTSLPPNVFLPPPNIALGAVHCSVI